MLGREDKKVSKSENKNIFFSRRSIFAKTKIIKGDIFTHNNLVCKRPLKGVPASKYLVYLGKKSKYNYSTDDIIDGAVLVFQRKKHAHATWPELYQVFQPCCVLVPPKVPHQCHHDTRFLPHKVSQEFINLFGCGGTLFQAGCLAIQKLITYVCMVKHDRDRIH